MPLTTEEDREAARTAFLEQSLDDSHATRWGYFGICGPLAIGDDSTTRISVRKPPAEDGAEPFRHPQTNPVKKGQTPDVYFSFEPPLCVGDPYVDPHRRNRSEKVKQVDPEASFKPPGAVKYTIMGADGTPYVANKLGYAYMGESDDKDPKDTYNMYKDSEAFAAIHPRNFFTSPSKKGGAGIYPPGVLFGDPDNDRKIWEHCPAGLSDPYDVDRAERRKELEAHKAKCPEAAFKGNHYGRNPFQPDSEAYECNVPRGLPKIEQKKDYNKFPHEMAFKPSNGRKTGAESYMGYDGLSFPAWHEEGPAAKFFKKKQADDVEVPPWRPNHPRQVCNPMPSIVTSMRNMRAERPSSFMRPSLSGSQTAR